MAIPWSTITGGGIPSSFVFFGYLTSSGGYVYGNSPSDNPGAFIGTSATYTQYFLIMNTGNGSSTPPFSNEQPSGLSAAAENTQVTLRFRTGHFDVDGVTARAFLFDTASGNTTGPIDTSLGFDQNIAEVTVKDAISGPAGFSLISATSNEPPVGNSIQVFVIGTPSTQGFLQAARNGSGSGRVYTLTYQGMDQAGLSTTCSAPVTVPHDQAPQKLTEEGTTHAPRGVSGCPSSARFICREL